ncbi:MAG: nucleoside hydrolase [Clostridia bacterium]|nr:nucleoside hydrolase [Clostridia bacterium]
MTYPVPIIYDGDPGHDDAIAMLLAKASDNIDVLAVTTCCGNQTIEKTTYNAQRVCTLIGLDVPIGMGQARPLLAQPMTAPNIHGQSGLDGPRLPEPEVGLSSLRAVALMAKTLQEAERPVTIVSTGPLTNTAALLLTHPELKAKIERISLMGGGIAHGNWTPAAEFNILVDPEAADIVFSSGIPIVMAGLDVTEQALIYEEDFDRIRALGGEIARVVAEWLDYFYQFHRSIGYIGAPLHDPCAVAYLIAPELFEFQDYYVRIDTHGEFTRGATVADINRQTGIAPNARCLTGIDRQGFVDLLAESVRRLSHG